MLVFMCCVGGVGVYDVCVIVFEVFLFKDVFCCV